MKRLLASTILALYSIVAFTQNEDMNESKLIRVYDGDSTFIIRHYEIDLHKKKIYAINPVVNYLDIKDGKAKYRVKVKREKWNKVEKLLSEINLSEYEQATFDNSYSISLFFEENKVHIYNTRIESELKKLKALIKTIRE